MFGTTEKKLLNIEQVFHWNSFKSDLKTVGEFGKALGIVGKLLVSKI